MLPLRCTCKVCGREYVYDDENGYHKELCSAYCDGKLDGTRQSQKALASYAKEHARLITALEEIAYHGTDMPSALNCPEAEWWQKVVQDCMGIAVRALRRKDNG